MWLVVGWTPLVGEGALYMTFTVGGSESLTLVVE